MAAAAPAAGVDAAAAIEVEEVKEAEEREDGEVEADDECEEGKDDDNSEDLITHYHQVADSQANYDEQWLTVLWSHQNSELQTHYRMEGFEYWTK